MKRLWIPILALACAAPFAFAGEPADDNRLAERAGRLLLADDAAKRAEGEKILLDRIKQGGDLAGFVKRMANAAKAWADADSRLIDVWIRQATDGDQETRERAVRLITAMGERAVMRLALELSHERKHQRGVADPAPPSNRVSAPGSDQAAGGDQETDSGQEPDAGQELAVAPHLPRVYDVTALRTKGMNPVQVLSFLREQANASDVGAGPVRYVVYADAAGHKRLTAKLAEVRKLLKKSAPKDDDEQAKKNEGKKDGDAPPPAPVTAAAPGKPALPKPLPAAAAAGPRFTVQPIVVRVPRDAGLVKKIASWAGVDKDLITPFLEDARTQRAAKAPPKATRVVGDLTSVNAWIAEAPKLPEARTSYGERLTVTAGVEARSNVGKQVPYRRSVSQGKRGAWRVDQDILQTGLELRFLLAADGSGLKLTLDARLSELSKPMATTNVRPAKDADPIELDLPEWNRQTRSDSLSIAKTGGGLLMVMPDPGKNADGLALILLHVEPARPEPAQQMNRNAAPNPQKGGDN